ncbi:MAG: hypothetical protein GTO18_15835 [Anaerolineales bacterium]|nr:hypothetical protein [Anaerolineales bacterium]
MCCFFTALFAFGPRLAVLIWWLVNPIYVNAAVDNSWILAILGWIFLPWTLIMFLIVAPGGIMGFDWIWLALGLIIDLGSYGGGAYGNRSRLGY